MEKNFETYITLLREFNYERNGLKTTIEFLEIILKDLKELAKEKK